jgi:hypothetical protein
VCSGGRKVPGFWGGILGIYVFGTIHAILAVLASAKIWYVLPQCVYQPFLEVEILNFRVFYTERSTSIRPELQVILPLYTLNLLKFGTGFSKNRIWESKT